MSGTTTVPLRRAVEQVMGLPVSVALRGRHADDDAGRTAWEAVVDELRAVDAVFSRYRPNSFVSRLGRGEIDVADCPVEVGEVLALGELARVRSGGAFDVRRRGADGRLVLDTDGVVKGWAVERAAAHLAALDDTDFCLSAGGDMVCHVSRPDSPAWRIGVEHPHDPSRLVARIPVRHGAVATSGTSHRGAHVVDARTGLAPAGIASVTVVSEHLTDADIDATTALALGADGLTWLTRDRSRSGLVVWKDGRVESYCG